MLHSKGKVKMHTLDIAPLRSESPLQKRSGMARILKGCYEIGHGPISYRFRDRPTRRFQSKIAKFFHLCEFCASTDGVLLGIGYRRRVRKTGMMGLPDGPKRFKIGLTV